VLIFYVHICGYTNSHSHNDITSNTVATAGGWSSNAGLATRIIVVIGVEWSMMAGIWVEYLSDYNSGIRVDISDKIELLSCF
jgi:hypothetical protein